MSQIKGSALIEVYDAKTNKKLYEQKEDNIITHAYEKILQDYRGKLGYSLGKMFGNSPSISHALFGGILLFGSVIPSDANHMLPTDAEMQSFVGCASYQGKIKNNNYAGEFSTEESEFTDDHAKFVYNFNTAEANGVINTICLTSSIGGYTGYKQSIQTEYPIERSYIQSYMDSSDDNLFIPKGYSTSSYYGVVNGFNIVNEVQNDAVICDNTGKSYHIYGEINKAVNLQKEITRKILLSKVNQTVIPTARFTDIDALKEYVSEPITSLDVDKLYWLNTSSYNTDIKDTLTLHYISMDEPETTKTYNTTSLKASINQFYGSSGYKFTECCCIYNGKLYVYVYNNSDRTKGRIYVVSLNESSSDCSFVYSDFTVTQLMMNGTDTPTYLGDVEFIRVNDTIYMSRDKRTSDYGNYYFRVDPTTGAVDTDGSTFVHKQLVQSTGDFGKQGIFETYDGLYLTSPYSNMSYGEHYLSGLYLPSGYLASINNLQNAINKTAERTLKITYTLTYK